MSRTNGQGVQLGMWALLIAPAAIFLFLGWKFSYNFPCHDDFDTPIRDIVLFFEATNWQEKLGILTKFHADHRVFLLRIESLIVLAVNGTLNFKAITILNLTFFILSFFIVVLPQVHRRNLLPLLPLPFFLFTMNFNDALFWAHVSANYAPVILLVVLISYLLAFQWNRKTDAWKASFVIVLCVLCSLTFANGLFSFLLLPVYFFYQREYKLGFVSVLLCILAFRLHFFQYVRADYLGTYEVTFKGLLFSLYGFLSLLGSAFVFVEGTKATLCFMLGIALVVVLLSVLVKIIRQRGFAFSDTSVFYLLILLFVFITMAGISMGRANSHEGVLYLLGANRYKFYSTYAVLIIYLIFIDQFKIANGYFIGFIIWAAGFNVVSYFKNKRQLDFNFKTYRCAEFNWQHNNKGLFYYLTMQETAVAVFKDFINKGYYEPNRENYEVDFSNLSKYNTDSLEMKQDTILRVFGSGEVKDIILRFENRNESLNTDLDNGYYILMKSKGNLYKFPGMPKPNPGLNFTKNAPGFDISVNMELLKEGEYEIYSLYEYPGGVHDIRATNLKLKI